LQSIFVARMTEVIFLQCWSSSSWVVFVLYEVVLINSNNIISKTIPLL